MNNDTVTADFFRFSSDRYRYDFLVGETRATLDGLERFCADQYLDLTLEDAAETIARSNANVAIYQAAGILRGMSLTGDFPTWADAYRAYADNVIDTCREYNLGSACARVALNTYRQCMANAKG